MRKHHIQYLAPQRRTQLLKQTAISLSCVLLGAFSLSSFASESQLIQKLEDGKYSKKGTKTCLKCHKRNKTVMAIFDSVHGNTEQSDSPMAGKQCETCHGPQGKHRGKNEPMIGFDDSSNLSTEFKNSICFSCHNDEGRSEHADGEACVSCHELHVTSEG